MYNINYYNHNIKKYNNNLLLKVAKCIVNNIDSDSPYYQIFKKHGSQRLAQTLRKIADKIRNTFSDLVVISMGGATLNPEMLVKFLGQDKYSPRIYFLNNTDPFFFIEIINAIELKNSAFIGISNSGDTLETNSLVGCMLQEYQKNNIQDVSDRSFFITNN